MWKYISLQRLKIQFQQAVKVHHILLVRRTTLFIDWSFHFNLSFHQGDEGYRPSIKGYKGKMC